MTQEMNTLIAAAASLWCSSFEFEQTLIEKMLLTLSEELKLFQVDGVYLDELFFEQFCDKCNDTKITPHKVKRYFDETINESIEPINE